MVGLNQNYSKVFVIPAGKTLLAAGTTTALDTTGQLGIFNAATYAAVAAPTFPAVKAILFAQGTPDLSALPVPAGVRNETDKSHIIQARKIVGWKGKQGQTGQNQIVTVGYDGTDTTKTISGRCDEIKHLYIRFTGKPIENLSPGGYIVHVQANGPCCDTCGDNCSDVVGCTFRDQFYDELMTRQFPGGILVSKYVNITKLDGTNTTPDPDVAVCGLRFESAFVGRTTNLCYYDIFPYEADPIHIEITTYDPDWNASPCPDSDFPITELQAVEYAVGSGEAIIRIEERSKMDDYRFFSRDLGIRLAEGTTLYTNPAATYDEYILTFDFDWSVLGWSEIYNDRYDLHFYFVTGSAEGTAFRTAMNTYVTAANTSLTPVAFT